MADILLFHHALGLSAGVRSFADRLRAAGHDVTTPDLYAGRTFATVDEGVAYAEELGFDTIVDQGLAAAEHLPRELVYAGFSLGAMPAQQLALQRLGARGLLLFHGAAPLEAFDGSWPAGLPLQMHIAVDDPFDDLPVMQELAASTGGELFTYAGDAHLFTDSSLADHDPDATELVVARTLDLLTRLP